MSLDVTVTHTGDTSLAKIIGGIFSNDPKLARKYAKKTKAFFDNLVTRTMKSTGFELRKKMRNAIIDNAFGFAPLQRYSKNGAVMARTIRGFFTSGKSQVPRANKFRKTLKGRLGKLNFKDRSPGINFNKIFAYDASSENVEVGVLPKAQGGKASEYWVDAFAEFQEAGTVDIPYSGQRGQGRGIHGLMGAAQMPVRSGVLLRRPSRPFIATAQKKLNPQKVFTDKLIEKLNR